MQKTLVVMVVAAGALAQTAAKGPLADAQRELTARHFAEARAMFADYAKTHPESVDAQMGVADADLGLKHYLVAEGEYRKIVAAQPTQWLAHKNLVLIEAALGRWEEFDRERALLRVARRTHLPGLSTRESDLIDAFDVTVAGKPQHWIVREYFEPAGRSLTRYNFELFSAEGRVVEYISLESAAAAAAAVAEGDVLRGDEARPAAAVTDFTLDWYTGAAHGVIRSYPQGEPSYEDVRREVMRWVRMHPAGR